MKTNKSYTKRLKQTGGGKLTSRKSGQNHFNAKESGEKSLQRKRTKTFELSNKNRARFLNE